MKNMFIKVLSVVMALTMIMGAFGTIALAADAACDHEWVKGDTEAPTCKAPGYTTYKCSKCQEVQLKDIVPSTGEEHVLVDAPAVAATCTTPAKSAGKVCKLCEADFRETNGVALGHEYGPVEWTEPTCNTVGQVFKTCGACGDKLVLQTINANPDSNAAGVTCHVGDHNYVYIFEELPSCTEGTLLYMCTYCNNIKAEVVGVGLSHDFDWDDDGNDDVVTVDSTCTATGTHTKTCETCGYKDVETIAAKDHDYDRNNDGVVDASDYVGTAATCTTAGTLTRKCEVCDFEDNSGIDNAIIPHTMVALTQVCDCVLERNNDADKSNDVLKLNQAATCYEAGYQWYHCSVCDFIGNKAGTQGNAEVIPQSEAHNWNATLITKTMSSGTDCPATVAKYRKCDDCGIEELVEWVEDGHEWYTQAEWKEAHPTYTIVGANTDTYYKVVGAGSCVTATQYFRICKVCGIEKLDDSKTVDAVPHTWEAQDKWQYVPYTGNLKPCEAGAANYYIRECTECDAEENVLYFTKPHTMNAYSCEAGCAVGQCDNCEHTGRKLICSVCLGNAQDAKYTHVWVLGTQVTAANCSDKATYNYSCGNTAHGCTQTKVDVYGEVNPNHHNEDYFIVITDSPATCVADGTRYGTCTYCDPTGLTYYTEVIPALAHGNNDANKGTAAWTAEWRKITLAAKASTCTATGYTDEISCAKCNTVITESTVTEMAPHTPVAIGTYVAPTCMSKGMTAGEKCDICDFVIAEQEEIEIDANAHFGDPTVVYTVPSTCTHGTITYNKYGNEADKAAGIACGHTAPVESDDLNRDNHVQYTNPTQDTITGVWSFTEVSYDVTVVAPNAPLCVATGNHGYSYCSGCKLIYNVDTGAADTNEQPCADPDNRCTNHTALEALEHVLNTTYKYFGTDATADTFVIAARGHHYALYAAKVYETCTADGTQEIWRCDRTLCDAKENIGDETTPNMVGHLCPDTYKHGEKIPAHGTSHNGYREFAERLDATCLNDGHEAGKFCSICADNGYTDPDDCEACDGNNWLIVTNGHSIVLDATSVKSCTNAGYKVYKCENCDATATTKTGEKIGGVVKEVGTAIWYFTDYEAAGHYFKTDADGDGKFEVVLSDEAADCYAPARKIQECVYCDYEEVVSTTGEALGHTTELGCEAGTACTRCLKTVEHNFTTIITNDPNFEGYDCSKNTVITNWCQDCNTTVVVDTINAPGHVYKGTVSYTEPTDLANGVWVWTCGTCHMDIETEIEMTRNVTLDLSVVPYIEGMNSANLTAVNGGLVEVTVSITVGETIVKGFDYQLNYNANKLEFVSAELAYNEFLRDGEYVEVDKFEVSDNDGSVKVSAFFLGDTAIMSGENTALVKFIFKVAPTATVITANDIVTPDATFQFLNETGTDNVIERALPAALNLELMGDVNNDGKYDGVDMAWVLSIVRGVEGFEYTNVADVNNDGEVTVADYGKIAKFATSNQTVADYYAMFSYDITAILNSFVYADYSGDGNINEIDKNLINNALEGVYANADAAWTATLAVGYYEKLLADLADGLLNP